MSKNYGPKGFEKAFEKALNGFNETKIFFSHNGSETTVKYIDGNQLLGVTMYRGDWTLDLWIPHFQHYLDTGVFDTHAYWVQYTSVRNPEDNTVESTVITEPVAIPMVLKDKVWSIHSPAMNKYMDNERSKKGDIGFKHVPRQDKKETA